MTVEFTMKDLEAEVRKIVAENPEYGYRSAPDTGNCTYTKQTHVVYDGDSGEEIEFTTEPCLFGRALMNLGADEDFLALQENGISSVLGWLGVLDVDDASVDACWCERLQAKQDLGKPWGEALDAVDKYYEKGKYA